MLWLAREIGHALERAVIFTYRRRELDADPRPRGEFGGPDEADEAHSTAFAPNPLADVSGCDTDLGLARFLPGPPLAAYVPFVAIFDRRLAILFATLDDRSRRSHLRTT